VQITQLALRSRKTSFKILNMSSLRELMELQTSNELAKKRLTFILDELAKKNKQVAALESKMLKEHEDVEALENMSIKSVFRKILGDKEAQLQEKVANAVDVASQIKTKLAIRKKEVMLNGSEVGKRITNLESENNKYYYIRKECLEAIEVGNSAISVMEEMMQSLRSAQSWGHWTRGNRNKGVSTVIKMTAVDKAKKLSHQAQQLLRIFIKELADINGQQNFNFRFDFGGFDSFLNVFFDNLISDWVVNKKIATALNSVLSTQAKVKRVVYSLEVDVKKSEAEIVKREDLVKELIKNSF